MLAGLNGTRRAAGRLSLAVVVLAVAAGPACAGAGDRWLGPDKPLHFGAGFVLAGAGYAGGAALVREPVVRFGVGTMVAMGAGLAKEMHDRVSGGDPSLRDLSWDAIGTLSGLLSAWAVDRWLLHR